MKSKEILKSLLSEFFHYLQDKDAIIGIRKAIQHRENFNLYWEKIKEDITKRALPVGDALRLIQEDANLPLHRDTEGEAYNWFEWLIKNVEAENESDITGYDFHPPFDDNTSNPL